MQTEYVHQLRRAVSDQRLEPYRRQALDDDLEVYGIYAWNIALCESLYPALNSLEIALRNSIHNAATAEFGDENWFDSLSLSKTKRALQSARYDLENLGKTGDGVTAGKLVAQLTFGFWVGLFDSHYEQQLWSKLLRPVFPNIPRKLRTRRVLSDRLHRVRRMRNRVFHHEPIWYWQDLGQHHQDIIETIDWINVAMVWFVGTLDRFQEVHSRRPQPYKDQITSAFQVPPGP